MNKILLLLLFIPVLSPAQSKKKKLKAELEANTILVNNLKRHVQYLSGALPGGNGTGEKGATVLQYITDQYQQLGVDPAGTSGYLQEFSIDEGKEVEKSGTFLKVNEKNLELNKDYFPLAFSAVETVKGSPAIALNESAQPWFTDLKDVWEENQNDPNFDTEGYIRKEAEKIKSRGGTALLLYNSSSLVDHVKFNKDDPSPAAAIPVLYITRDGMKKYCNDISATLNIELGVLFSRKIKKSDNIIGFIDNHAPVTVVLSARLGCSGNSKINSLLMDTLQTDSGQAADNVSGIAALIELTRLLKSTSLSGNNYLIGHFSDGDSDFSGSKYWWEHPTRNIRPNYVANIEMQGSYDTAHPLNVCGYGLSSDWKEVFTSVTNKNLIVKVDSSGSKSAGGSDFFRRKNIPVLLFLTGNQTEDHKIASGWNTTNYDGTREIVQYIYQLIVANNARGRLLSSPKRN
jgi:hypothetical protein